MSEEAISQVTKEIPEAGSALVKSGERIFNAWANYTNAVYRQKKATQRAAIIAEARNSSMFLPSVSTRLPFIPKTTNSSEVAFAGFIAGL